jgi:hypothetical protein
MKGNGSPLLFANSILLIGSGPSCWMPIVTEWTARLTSANARGVLYRGEFVVGEEGGS